MEVADFGATVVTDLCDNPVETGHIATAGALLLLVRFDSEPAVDRTDVGAASVGGWPVNSRDEVRELALRLDCCRGSTRSPAPSAGSAKPWGG